MDKKDFSYLLTTRSLTITFNGETKTVLKSDRAYELLLNAIREERWDDIPDLLKPEEVLNTVSGGQMRVADGQVYVRGADGNEFAAPTKLNDTILLYRDQKLPFEPLVRFAEKLSENPSYRSVQQLFDFLEHNNFTITDEGNFIAYKGVTKDFKDCRTKTFDNSIGSIVKMPRNQVNEDPDQGCSTGLHVGNYKFSHSGWGGGSRGVTIVCEVNPKDVVSVPTECDFAKMRVCEYKVIGLSKGEYKTPIYDSSKTVDENYADDQTEDDICNECGCSFPNCECCPDCEKYDCECDLCDECGGYDCECDLCDECGEYNCECEYLL